MASLRQINASRTNGARSRGPVTPEGKARSAQNGAKHGIYTQLVVLHNEDHSMYLASREAHLVEWAPTTETEHNFVIDIVDARWRLRRFSTLETAAIDFEVERMQAEIAQTFSEIDEGTRTVLGFNALLVSNRTFEVLQTAIRAQHRIIDRATANLIRLAKIRGGDLPPALQPERAAPQPVVPPAASNSSSDAPAAARSNPEPATATENHRNEPGPARIPSADASKHRNEPGVDPAKREQPLVPAA